MVFDEPGTAAAATAGARAGVPQARPSPERLAALGVELLRGTDRMKALTTRWMASCIAAVSVALIISAMVLSYLNRHRVTTLFALRRIDEAFASIDRAVALEPEAADHRWNQSLLQLLVGNFDQGW